MRTRGQEPRRPPWQRLGNHDGFVIKGIHYRTQQSDRNGQLLREVSRPAVTAFWDHVAWEAVRNEPGFEHHPDQYNPNRPDFRKEAGVPYASDIPPAQLRRMFWLEDLILDLERRYRSGETTLDPVEVQALIDGEMGRIARERNMKRQLGENALGGQDYRAVGEIKASALLRKRRDYLARGFGALRDGRYRSGNIETLLQPDVAAIIAVHLAEGLKTSADANSIHDDIRDEIEERNARTALAAAAAVEEGSFHDAEFLRVPDIKTVRRAKKNMDRFRVDVGKFGVDAAVRLNPVVRGKPDNLGPLDRVEYDESIVDAITLLTESGAWTLLTEEEKKRIKRVRMVIGVAICVATRCIVAMRIYKAGNADETVATFRMIYEDKTKYIPLEFRDKLSWHQFGGVGTVVVDQGSSNISEEARTALANLNVPILVIEAGRPEMRGTGERIFRTFGSEIYCYLDARTGYNVIDRRKYRPEGRASLATDELWKVMVLGVVGIYHNTPHRELGGRTPAYEWERLIPDYGINPLPDPNRRRVTFGRRRMKKATRFGVAFAGLSYSNALIEYHYLHGVGDLEVAGDPEDLSAVSVKFGPAWYEAPCTDPDIGPVRLEDWLAACGAEKDLANHDANKRREARRAAKKAIRAIQEHARERTGVPPVVITDEMIDQAESRIFGEYEHADEDRETNNGQLGIAVEPNNDLTEGHDVSAVAAPQTPTSSPASTRPDRPKARKTKKWNMSK